MTRLKSLTDIERQKNRKNVIKKSVLKKYKKVEKKKESVEARLNYYKTKLNKTKNEKMILSINNKINYLLYLQQKLKQKEEYNKVFDLKEEYKSKYKVLLEQFKKIKKIKENKDILKENNILRNKYFQLYQQQSNICCLLSLAIEHNTQYNFR